MSYSMNDSKDSGAPKRGRPKRGQGPGVPWQEVDQLLVLGEDVLNEKTGRPEVHYPTYRELSSRYSVSASLIATYAAKHQCMKRREENIARTQAQFEQKLIEKRAEVRAMSAAEAIEIIDGYMQSFRQAMEEGRVRTDSAADFNTLARLKAFLEGKADSRQEVQGVITLEQMQERHRALRAQLESLDPAVTGELPPRHRDRARGLLAESADRSKPDSTAPLSRQRADGGVEAHERDDELVDDVPTEDREEAPRGNVRVLRQRADRDDDVERAPRRRVVAHEREDEPVDDVLAEEREESPRGDVGVRRRRKPEHEDFDDDAELEEARVPRRARAVKPADVRALRRRTREEIEDGRVPRRARAVEPERATARRPRRPGREERERFPAVVDARRPGRGWEDEPEQIEPGLRRPGRGWR